MNNRRWNRAVRNRAGRQVFWVVLAALIIVICLVVVIFNQGDGKPWGGGGGSETDPLLELTRTALASTENLEVTEADSAWVSLREQVPDDPSIALNHAINRVLRVDQLSAQATNAALGDEDKQAARQQLPAAISDARAAIDSLETVTNDDVLPLWLRTRVDLHEASLLPGSMTKSLRREVYQRLSAAINGEIGKNPRAIMLGGTLISVVQLMEDPIDGLPDDLLTDATNTVSALSDQHPDNLFFALRAARLNIDKRDKRAVDFVRRAERLAQAIEPSIRRETAPIGVTPSELVGQIVTAVEEANWSEADTRMLLWFNVLNSTEIVKTDRRRASPHPLDLLSFETLRRLSAEAADDAPLDVSESKIAFEKSTISDSSSSVAIHTIDFDLDLDADLVSLDDSGRVTLWSNDETWQEAGEVTLSHEATGLLAADLFASIMVVLAGIIGRLLAQGLSPLDAACLGAWVHGRAGEAVMPLGEGQGASGVADALPGVLAALRSPR